SELRHGRALQLAAEEVQLHLAVGIRMPREENFHADKGVDAKLLANLARQTYGRCFARLALSAGEFPMALEVCASLAPGDEEPPALLHHSGGDDDGHAKWRPRRARQLSAIGQTRHFGLRATHTIAPKSMRA